MSEAKGKNREGGLGDFSVRKNTTGQDSQGETMPGDGEEISVAKFPGGTCSPKLLPLIYRTDSDLREDEK